MSTPPTLRSLCESARPSDFILSERPQVRSAYEYMRRRLSPEVMLKVLDALENMESLATKEGWNTALFSSEFGAALKSTREALTLLNGSTPDTT